MSHHQNEPFATQTITSGQAPPTKPSTGHPRWSDDASSAGPSGRGWWIACALLHLCHAIYVAGVGVMVVLTLRGVWQHRDAATQLDVESEGALAISVGAGLVIFTVGCALGISYFLSGLVLSMRRHPAGPIMLIGVAVLAVLPVRSAPVDIGLWGWRDSLPTIAAAVLGVAAILVASMALGGPHNVRPRPESVAGAAMPVRR